MDSQHQEEILKELRAVTAHHQSVRKNTRRAVWIILAIYIAGTIIAVVFAKNFKDEQGITGTEEKWDWHDVARASETGDIKTGIKIGEALILRNLQNDQYHIRLGKLYNMDGQLDRAKAQFTAACEILPIDRNLDYLRAIERKIDRSK